MFKEFETRRGKISDLGYHVREKTCSGGGKENAERKKIVLAQKSGDILHFFVYAKKTTFSKVYENVVF